MLVDFYISGSPRPTVTGYVFLDDNKHMDQRVCKALISRNLVAMGSGSYFTGRPFIASRLVLTDEGEQIAERLYDETEKG